MGQIEKNTVCYNLGKSDIAIFAHYLVCSFALTCIVLSQIYLKLKAKTEFPIYIIYGENIHTTTIRTYKLLLPHTCTYVHTSACLCTYALSCLNLHVHCVVSLGVIPGKVPGGHK